MEDGKPAQSPVVNHNRDLKSKERKEGERGSGGKRSDWNDAKISQK